MKRALVFAVLFVVILFAFVPYLHADTLPVTGTIAPKASDFQLALFQDASGTVPQETNTTYTITYGSHLYYSGQIIVEAQWYQGKISGASSPSIDGLEYVSGSATHGYGNSSPVVDLVNGKIDWTINNFPSQTTDQTVTFKLKTNAAYTGTGQVDFPIKVRVISPNFTTADQSVTTSYVYSGVPAITSSPTPSPTPSVTPTPTQIQYINIALSSITDKTITLSAATTQDATIKVKYGTSPTQLTNTLTDLSLSKHHTIFLSGLKDTTTYYVQITATTEIGTSITSDLYSFTTAKTGETVTMIPSTLSFISNNILLYKGKIPDPNEKDPQEKAVLILPPNIAYTFKFQVLSPEKVKRIQAVLRNKYVLGITSDDTSIEEPNTQITDLVELQPGIFSGRLKSPATPGYYEAFTRIYATNGSIFENKLADLIVSTPLRVENKKTKKQIEGAQVYILYQNPRTKIYTPLSSQLFAIKNPGYTNDQGELILPLPEGMYKVHITAPGFEEKDITFTLGAQSGQKYPVIQLTPQPFNIVTFGTYYWKFANDFLSSTKTYVKTLSSSSRFFELNALITSLLLVLLTFVSFSRRIRIPISSLLNSIFHAASVRNQKTASTIQGKIFDKETGLTVSGANVFLIDSNTNSILFHTISNLEGCFLFSTLPNKTYSVSILTDGYEPASFKQSDLQEENQDNYSLCISKRGNAVSLTEKLKIFTETFLAMWFEVLLLASFVFEVAIGYMMGWEKVLLFLVFSAVNLCLWIFHVSVLRTSKSFL